MIRETAASGSHGWTPLHERGIYRLSLPQRIQYGISPMSNSPYVFDASADNFQRLVLENSAKGPVLVNYWVTPIGK